MLSRSISTLLIYVCFFIPTFSKATVVPPNPITKKYFSNFYRSNLTELEFNYIVDSFGNYFSNLARVHSSRLVMEKYWANPLVNLYAENFNTVWFIHVFGGYARLPGLNVDTLQMSLCHELAHHIAGFPYKSSWSTAEGQADYFATHACLDELWKREVEQNKTYARLVDPYSKSRCVRAYTHPDKQNLCFRKAVSALALARIFAKIQNTPDIDPAFDKFTPVSKTIFEHVPAQCRFETLMRGALCSKSYNWKIIPGRVPGSIVPTPSDPHGSNEVWAEKQSAQSVCVDSVPSERLGARPNCWYSDRLSTRLNRP